MMPFKNYECLKEKLFSQMKILYAGVGIQFPLGFFADEYFTRASVSVSVFLICEIIGYRVALTRGLPTQS